MTLNEMDSINFEENYYRLIDLVIKNNINKQEVENMIVDFYSSINFVDSNYRRLDTAVSDVNFKTDLEIFKVKLRKNLYYMLSNININYQSAKLSKLALLHLISEGLTVDFLKTYSSVFKNIVTNNQNYDLCYDIDWVLDDHAEGFIQFKDDVNLEERIKVILEKASSSV